MIMRYIGKTIEFSEEYRPEKIIVDGKEMSMDMYAKNHGFNWRGSTSGNVLMYEAEDGSGIEIEQSAFFDKKRRTQNENS